MFKSIPKTQPISKNSSQYRKEGEIRIEKNVQQKSHFSENDGEYVDYEEIK
jgi:hypothetical protein